MGDHKRQEKLPLSQMREARVAFAARLRVRRPEIEEAALARIYALADPGRSDPVYVEGLRAALSAALDHGFIVVERGEERSPPVPQALLSQARLAARSGIGLDTVLRRYVAGHALLGDFLLQEADTVDLPSTLIQRIIRDLSVIVDRLLTVVTGEYARESKSRRGSTIERRAERVRRLLAGELLDTSELAYDFEAWHLGMAIGGAGATEAIRELATLLGRPLLSIRGDEGTVWAWLGGQRKIGPKEYDIVSSAWPSSSSLAIGEPAQGRTGWRLTHRQAQAALPIAVRRPNRPIRYADVALIASALQDDLLVTSLRNLYLVPLSEEKDKGKTLRETLRAYLSNERNISSTAAALGVSRRTVANRLHTIETKLARPLSATLPGVEAALYLDEFGILA